MRQIIYFILFLFEWLSKMNDIFCGGISNFAFHSEFEQQFSSFLRLVFISTLSTAFILMCHVSYWLLNVEIVVETKMKVDALACFLFSWHENFVQ